MSAELFIQLRRHGRADRGVALLGTEERDGAKKRIHRVAIRHRVIGKIVAEIFERKLEALGQAHGVGDGVRSIAKERFHFCARSSNAVPRYSLGECPRHRDGCVRGCR